MDARTGGRRRLLVELVTEEQLLGLVWESTYTLIIGVIIALVAGVSIGMLMGRYHTVQ